MGPLSAGGPRPRCGDNRQLQRRSHRESGTDRLARSLQEALDPDAATTGRAAATAKAAIHAARCDAAACILVLDAALLSTTAAAAAVPLLLPECVSVVARGVGLPALYMVRTPATRCCSLPTVRALSVVEASGCLL